MDDSPFTEDLPLASVTTGKELCALLRTVHLRADKPSLRSLESRTRHDPTPLSRSTVSAILRGERLPRKAVMLAFLRACGVRDDQTDPWRRVWERIAAHDVEPSESDFPSAGLTLAPRETDRLQEQIIELNADNDRLRLLLDLSRNSKEQGWWQHYDVPYRDYIALEASAISLRSLRCTVLPGLLQTAEYARALHERAGVELSREQIEQGVQARLNRQSLFASAKPPHLWVLLDEAALHRLVGSPTVMRNQLAQIIEFSRLSNLSIQVIPYEAGALPSGEDSFTILEFEGPIPEVVYMEAISGGTYLRQGQDVELYTKVFEQLRQMALDTDGSVSLIKSVVEGIS